MVGERHLDAAEDDDWCLRENAPEDNGPLDVGIKKCVVVNR
jgi:hypothetical protein